MVLPPVPAPREISMVHILDLVVGIKAVACAVLVTGSSTEVGKLSISKLSNAMLLGAQSACRDL